jgi:hypothetical protein
MAPGQVHELGIRAGAQHLRVPIGKVVVQLRESRDLSRAYEGEILRPEENDFPLAFIFLKRQVLEGLALIQADDGFQFEIRKSISYSKHAFVVCLLIWRINVQKTGGQSWRQE